MELAISSNEKKGTAFCPPEQPRILTLEMTLNGIKRFIRWRRSHQNHPPKAERGNTAQASANTNWKRVIDFSEIDETDREPTRKLLVAGKPRHEKRPSSHNDVCGFVQRFSPQCTKASRHPHLQIGIPTPPPQKSQHRQTSIICERKLFTLFPPLNQDHPTSDTA
jgi:hypothetical protein